VGRQRRGIGRRDLPWDGIQRGGGHRDLMDDMSSTDVAR
jgi:hypothetical protein